MAAARQSWVSGWRGMKIPHGWMCLGGKGGVERTRHGGWAMDIRVRMKWCLAMWVRNRVAGSWFRMVVGVIVLYPYH